MKKILLIAPISPYYRPSIIGTAPLSGLLILATILRDRGHSVRVIDETITNLNYTKIGDVDVVLITAMSATVKRAYTIADIFHNKGITTILGGIHVSFQPEEALQHCSQVVLGEAEDVIIDVVEGRRNERIVNGGRISDLSTVPIPDYTLVEGVSKHPEIIGISTSRGCPFACTFCSLHPYFGRDLRLVPINKVIAFLSQFKTIKKLSFHDANFGMHKETAVSLLQQMKEHGISPRYSLVLQSIDAANNDTILKLMTEVSNFHLLIGFESLRQETLDFYHKKQTPEQIKKTIQKVHDYNIKIMGNFVFGADTDDNTIFQKIVDFCQYTEIDFPGFDCLTPFVGTQLRTNLETQHRIFTNDWDFYDMQHAVFYPKRMTPWELQTGLISAYENFFSTKRSLTQLKRLQFFQSFDNFYSRNYFKKQQKLSEQYLDYLQQLPISQK